MDVFELPAAVAPDPRSAFTSPVHHSLVFITAVRATADSHEILDIARKDPDEGLFIDPSEVNLFRMPDDERP